MTLTRIRGALAVLTGRAKAMPPYSRSLVDFTEQVSGAKIDEQVRFLAQARIDLTVINVLDDPAARAERIADAIHDIDVALGRKYAPTKASTRVEAAR